MQQTAENQMPEGDKKIKQGSIPSDWKVLSLGEVLTLQRGFDLPSYARKKGPIPVISSSGISDFHNEHMAKGPGVITGRYGTIGEVFYTESDYWPLNTTLYVKHFTGLVPRFAYYLLKTVDFQSHSGKSGVPGVNRNDVHAEVVVVPTENEQTAIAKALSDMDALIAGQEKLIAKKQAIKTATMQQLLTGKTRLPQFARHSDGSPKGYTTSELGEVPEDWTIKSYGDLFLFLSTSTNSRADLSAHGSCGYIHYGDIHTKYNIQLDLGKTSVPHIDSSKVSSEHIREGDLLMADASEDYEGVGKSIEVSNVQSRKIVAGLHTFLLRERQQFFASGFKGYLHKMPAVKDQIKRLATGLKIYGLSKANLETVLVPVPELEEQSAIATILSDMDSEIEALQQRLRKTRQIKQGMMQELLTGKIRLPFTDNKAAGESNQPG